MGSLSIYSYDIVPSLLSFVLIGSPYFCTTSEIGVPIWMLSKSLRVMIAPVAQAANKKRVEAKAILWMRDFSILFLVSRCGVDLLSHTLRASSIHRRLVFHTFQNLRSRFEETEIPKRSLCR